MYFAERSEDEFLPLSALQHYAFCQRQFALIHIEQQWAENVLTAEGRIQHEKAHDADTAEKRGELMITRGMPVRSTRLCLMGVCDVVEFKRSPEGVSLLKHEGTWLPYPVEYKRGRPKNDDCDVLQLCAQAMCLEEMLCCDIPEGALFYHEIRRREAVAFDAALRERVDKMARDMHSLYDRRHTPRVKRAKRCQNCSLSDICLPGLPAYMSASAYMARCIKEDEA